MSKRRLDKLEGSLSPKEAVIHWLGEAHAYGSLPAYAESLIGQPDTEQPFVVLPRRVADAIWASMRRQRTAVIKAATREAVGDTIFLLRLAIGLNLHTEETLRMEQMRHAALHWWSRALDPERRAKGDPKDGEDQDWQRGVAVSQGVLHGIEQARASAEARYLDGHDCLFPELAAAWRNLLEAAEHLSGGSSPDEDAVDGAEQQVRRVVRRARAEALDQMDESIASDALADRIVREQLHGPEGSS